MTTPNTPRQPEPIEAELLDEEQQELQADRLSAQAFRSEEDARKTADVIASFVQSYEQHKRELPLNEWLIREFRKYPGLWSSEAELQDAAGSLIASVQHLDQQQEALQQHLDRGKSRESWLAGELEKAAAAQGIANVGQFAGSIDQAMQEANAASIQVVTTRAGAISQAANLDGFIAEQHHASTFNLDAVAKGSSCRARVLTPEPGSGGYGKNSMDIGIYDGDGKLVARYQAKYGQDAEATQLLFERGDYRGQQKLVPAGQGDAIASKTTEVIEFGDVRSKPLSKAEAKALQEAAQQGETIRQYDWNDASRIDICRNIGQQAVLSAGITAAAQGTRILGRRCLNWVAGKGNPPVSEDLQEFFASSLKGARNVGIQTAVSAGMVVAVRSGWLLLSKSTPVNVITSIARTAMDTASNLYQLATGKISGREAIDNIACSAVASVGALAGAGKGAALGAALGSVLGPVGTAVGGAVGGLVGSFAGSSVAKALHSARKAVVKAGVAAIKTIGATVAKAATGLIGGAIGLVSSLFNW